jgi:hypothetical protein
MEHMNPELRKILDFLESVRRRVRWKDVFVDLPGSFILTCITFGVLLSVTGKGLSYAPELIVELMRMAFLGFILILLFHDFNFALMVAILIWFAVFLVFGRVNRRSIRIIMLFSMFSFFIFYGIFELFVSDILS